MQRLALIAALAALLGPATAHAGEAEPPKEQPKEAPKEEEKPANPFGDTKAQRPDAVPGKLTLSDGKEHRGKLFLTRDKKLELFDVGRQEWQKLDLKDLKSLTIAIEKEETVKEWRWKEAGSDVKVETGRTKVDRTYKCTAVKADDKKIEGHLRGTVIYVKEAEDKDAQRFFLLWNSPGDFDQKPEDLIYVKEVVFGEEAAKEPEKSSLKIIVTPKNLLFEEEEVDQPEKKPDGQKAPEKQKPATAPGDKGKP
jgi:hypothetical protein